MRLVILDTYDAASEWAAKYVRNTIHKFEPGPDKHFVLGLPTGKHSRQANYDTMNLIVSLVKISN